MYAKTKAFFTKGHRVTCIDVLGEEKVRRFRTHFFAVRFIRKVWNKYSNILYETPTQKKRKRRL